MARFPFLAAQSFEEHEDPDAAPGAYCGPKPRGRVGSFARARQNMLWVYLFGLVFLAFALTGGGSDGPSTTVAVLLCGVIAVGYAGAAWVADAPYAARCAYVVGYAAFLVATSAAWGWAFTNFAVYLAIMTATLLPWRVARVVVVVEGLLLLVAAVVADDAGPAYNALIAVGIALAVGAGIESGRVAARLRRAEQQVALLAVAAERERIARDLHDILGHSLTAVAVKAGLAARLVGTDAERARAEMAEVEAVARQALADVRATASGYREVRVAGEIASARSVLLAAGITADSPSALPALEPARAELFGWVVREAVTNVVRHSGAARCVVAVGPDEVSVTDDGRGTDVGVGRGGSGLAGLARRLEAAGGELVVEHVPGGGTRVVGRLPPVTSPTGPLFEVGA